MLRLLFLVIAFCLSISAYAADPASSSPQPITHVIYITLDGTRWQDIFLNKNILKKFKAKYAAQGHWYGEPGSNTTMEVASIPTSLPSYLSQMAGEVRPCDDNDCGRIRVMSLAETLKEKMGWPKKDVATFANWNKIRMAVEHVPGSTYVNAGNAPVNDPVTGKPDRFMARVNKLQAEHPEDVVDRLDTYTFAQAMHYWNKYQPRFMWLSLGDADEAAHALDLHWYYRVLAFYDDALDQIFTTLKKSGLDKSTLVIITTDHGRANGKLWTEHGKKYPESKQTWAFVMNGTLKPVSTGRNITHYSTLSIKPTIESAFGI